MANRTTKDEHSTDDLILFIELGVDHDSTCIETFGSDHGAHTDEICLDALNLTIFEEVLDLVFEDLVEGELGVVAEQVIVLGVDQVTFLVFALSHLRAWGHLDEFGGGQPRSLGWWELEEDLGIMDALQIFNVDEGEPDLLDFRFVQIWSSSIHENKWLYRLVIMSKDRLLLEGEESRSGPLVEIFVFEFNGLSGGISMFVLDEDLLGEILDVFDVAEEDALV